MYNFNYHQAKSVDEAAKLVSGVEEGKLMAGGMTLIPTLKQRLAKPSDVVDLGKIADLKGIKKDGNDIVIGAMTRHFDVANSDIVKSAIPGLAASRRPYRRSRRAQSRHDAAARSPTTIRRRIIPLARRSRSTRPSSPTSARSQADDFFKGLFETALEPGEIITAVSFPIPEKSAYMKFPNPASRYAIVGVLSRRPGTMFASRSPAPARRLPPEGDGSGADEELLARCDQGHQAER